MRLEPANHGVTMLPHVRMRSSNVVLKAAFVLAAPLRTEGAVSAEVSSVSLSKKDPIAGQLIPSLFRVKNRLTSLRSVIGGEPGNVPCSELRDGDILTIRDCG